MFPEMYQKMQKANQEQEKLQEIENLKLLNGQGETTESPGKNESSPENPGVQKETETESNGKAPESVERGAGQGDNET